MPAKKRRVSLLGAFEIQAENGSLVRDGLILGSRRDQLGFVIETSRESIEHIVALLAPPHPGLPLRLTASIGQLLETLQCELVRVELEPLPLELTEPKEGYGAYVQGFLIFRPAGRRAQRLAMTATEAIQVALRQGLTLMAADDLLQLDVTQLLHDMDGLQTERARDDRQFHSFVSRVTATDFQRFYEKHHKRPPDLPEED
ncbi:MAG: hypothetical protein VKP62_13765 [Candidatus Sericytochromatia bacterium]|nr:hypothetical protein [Candidatus Sericytochromatia bacterium]